MFVGGLCRHRPMVREVEFERNVGQHQARRIRIVAQIHFGHGILEIGLVQDHIVARFAGRIVNRIGRVQARCPFENAVIDVGPIDIGIVDRRGKLQTIVQEFEIGTQAAADLLTVVLDRDAFRIAHVTAGAHAELVRTAVGRKGVALAERRGLGHGVIPVGRTTEVIDVIDARTSVFAKFGSREQIGLLGDRLQLKLGRKIDRNAACLRTFGRNQHDAARSAGAVDSRCRRILQYRDRLDVLFGHQIDLCARYTVDHHQRSLIAAHRIYAAQLERST